MADLLVLRDLGSFVSLFIIIFCYDIVVFILYHHLPMKEQLHCPNGMPKKDDTNPITNVKGRLTLFPA